MAELGRLAAAFWKRMTQVSLATQEEQAHARRDTGSWLSEALATAQAWATELTRMTG
jgi:hypothetical protein